MQELNLEAFYFVLGASDNEMAAIERLISSLGFQYHYAMIGNTRVIASNAYQADSVTIPVGAKPVFVECACEGHYENAIVVDHHRLGDPGFNKPPEQYWQGSSIGQVAILLGIRQTSTLSLYAAADHCLTDAYAGKCPGISKIDMKYFRVCLAAENQNKSLSLVAEQISDALVKMQSMPKTIIGGVQVVDARGFDVPLGAEAAASEQIPYLLSAKMKDGRTKIVLLNAPIETTQYWMDTCGLNDVYGVPIRRFAGGYVNSSN